MQVTEVESLCFKKPQSRFFFAAGVLDFISLKFISIYFFIYALDLFPFFNVRNFPDFKMSTIGLLFCPTKKDPKGKSLRAKEAWDDTAQRFWTSQPGAYLCKEHVSLYWYDVVYLLSLQMWSLWIMHTRVCFGESKWLVYVDIAADDHFVNMIDSRSFRVKFSI